MTDNNLLPGNWPAATTVPYAAGPTGELGPGSMITLWADNRNDRKWAITVQAMAEAYVRRRPEPYEGNVMRDLVLFIAENKDDGGLASVWETPGSGFEHIEQLYDAVMPIVRRIREQQAGA